MVDTAWIFTIMASPPRVSAPSWIITRPNLRVDTLIGATHVSHYPRGWSSPPLWTFQFQPNMRHKHASSSRFEVSRIAIPHRTHQATISRDSVYSALDVSYPPPRATLAPSWQACQSGSAGRQRLMLPVGRELPSLYSRPSL